MLRISNYGLSSRLIVVRSASLAAVQTREHVPGGRQIVRHPPRQKDRHQQNERRAPNSRFPPSVQMRFDLINKHRDSLQQLDTKNLFNLSDGIEFAEEVGIDALSVILRAVEQDDKSFEDFTDQRFSAIIQAGGYKSSSLVSLNDRRTYIKKLWTYLSEKQGIDLGIRSFNAYLEVETFNSNEVSISELLEKMHDRGVEPNIETYEALALSLSREGNVTGIGHIVQELKVKNIPLSQRLVEAWVYALSLKDQQQDANRVIQVLGPSMTNTSRLFLSMARAHASKGRFDATKRCLTDIPASESNTNAYSMIELFFVLVKAGCPDALGIISPFLPPPEHEEAGLLPSNFDLRPILKRIKSEILAQNINGTLSIFELLRSNKPVFLQQLQMLYGYLARRFDKMSAHGVPEKERTEVLDSIIEWTSALEAKSLAKTPIADVINEMNHLNVPIGPLYKRFLKSEELERLLANQETEGSRSQLFLPYSLELAETLQNTKTLKPAQLDEVAEFLSANRLFTHFRELYAAVLQRDNSVLLELISRIERSTALCTYLVDKMLQADQMDRLHELMHSKVKGEGDIRVYMNRLITPILRKLKAPKLDDVELQTIAKVIAAGFGRKEDSTLEISAGGRAVALILGAGTISDQRISRLIQLLVDEPDVTVTPSEIRRIESQLREANLPGRADQVRFLRRKSQAYSRWLTSPIEDLEKESNVLDERDVQPIVVCSLLEVLLQKACESNPPDIPVILRALPKFYSREKEIPSADNKLLYKQRVTKAHGIALLHSMALEDWESVDKLWDMRPSRNAENILLYALTLCRRSRVSDAESALKSLKSSAVTLDVAVLNQISSSPVLQHCSLEELDKFMQLLTKEFNLSPQWKRRLCSEVKINHLRSLIDAGELRKAFMLAVDASKEYGVAFGAFELSVAGIKAEDSVLLKNIQKLIIEREDPNTAVIVLGVCMLELNHKRGADLLKKVGHVPSNKLRDLIRREVSLKKPQVLHAIFTNFNKPENSSIELTTVFEKTVELYEQQSNLEGLKTIHDEVKQTSFPLTHKLKIQIENAIKRLETAHTRPISNNSDQSSSADSAHSSHSTEKTAAPIASS